MSRARHRGHRPPGLFSWEQGSPTTEVDDVPDNPKHRPCPACHARPGEACSRPSHDGGRQPLRAIPGDPLRRGYHPARAVIPDEPAPEDSSPAGQLGAHGPEPVAPEPDDPEPAPTPQRPSQLPEHEGRPPVTAEDLPGLSSRSDWRDVPPPIQPPPSARAKADLRWAMNL